MSNKNKSHEDRSTAEIPLVSTDPTHFFAFRKTLFFVTWQRKQRDWMTDADVCFISEPEQDRPIYVQLSTVFGNNYQPCVCSTLHLIPYHVLLSPPPVFAQSGCLCLCTKVPPPILVPQILCHPTTPSVSKIKHWALRWTRCSCSRRWHCLLFLLRRDGHRRQVWSASSKGCNQDHSYRGRLSKGEPGVSNRIEKVLIDVGKVYNQIAELFEEAGEYDGACTASLP